MAARYKCVIKNYFSYFSIKTYVFGTQKNRLNEAVLLSKTIALQERRIFAFKNDWNQIARHKA